MRPSCCTSAYTAKDLSGTIAFLKIISEENRLRILCMLKNGEKCVCDIWQYLDIPQNLTSHHLKVLKDANLIQSRKDGVKVFYGLDTKNISQYKETLQMILNFN
jgi:ArsR family transcriptional regulator